MKPLPIKPTRHDVYDFISPTAGTKDAALGKKILITGACSDMGKSIAMHFAQAGACYIVLTDRMFKFKDLHDTEASIHAKYPKCRVLCVRADIYSDYSVDRLFQDIREEHIKLDILINNDEITGQIAPLAEGHSEGWWDGLKVNVRGTHMVTFHFLRQLCGLPGVVLNVSSRFSCATTPTMSSYEISMSALNRLTEFIDKEYARQGVVAIAFCPGRVPGTRAAETAPEWLGTHTNFPDTFALPDCTALYLTLPRAKFLSGRFVNAQWDIKQLETYRVRILLEDLLKMRVFGIEE